MDVVLVDITIGARSNAAGVRFSIVISFWYASCNASGVHKTGDQC